MEVWKDIKGYEGLYKVSSYGRVLGVKMNKTLYPSIDSLGYPRVKLSKNNSFKSKRIHCLVSQEFLKKPKGEKIITDHINNIKTDNNLKNLQYITQRINITKDVINSTGYTGVQKTKYGRYSAKISINKKVKYLGMYDTAYEASVAYKRELNIINNGEANRQD